MNAINFPVKFTFNITTLANDFKAVDTSGKTVAYVKQKMFKLKEDISIYDNEAKSNLNYKITADKWIDFSAAYSFRNSKGEELGKIARKGWASIWKAKYHVIDQNQKLQYQINEDNGWVKVADNIFGQLPIIGGLTGYVFNPSYSLRDTQGKKIARLKKEPSFFGRKFNLEQVGEMDADDKERIVLSFMMMVLLERRRG